MKPINRIERQLPWLLTELAEPRTPDYLDDLLWQTANTSQRPAWSILERWLPMVDIARQPVIAPRIPLRMVGLGLLVITLLLGAVAVLMIGTQRNLPPPFGPARNGLIAYSSGGDIYSVDPLTGAEVALVSGPETDPRTAMVTRWRAIRLPPKGARRLGTQPARRCPRRRVRAHGRNARCPCDLGKLRVLTRWE